MLSDGEIAQKMAQLFDLRPYFMIKRFGLKNPIFLPTATYGHFGRDPYKEEVEVYYKNSMGKSEETEKNGRKVYKKEVEFFAWEKLDAVEKIKRAFQL